MQAMASQVNLGICLLPLPPSSFLIGKVPWHSECTTAFTICMLSGHTTAHVVAARHCRLHVFNMWQRCVPLGAFSAHIHMALNGMLHIDSEKAGSLLIHHAIACNWGYCSAAPVPAPIWHTCVVTHMQCCMCVSSTAALHQGSACASCQ
jgi:hypothetical protein